jgi:hypothetical protein
MAKNSPNCKCCNVFIDKKNSEVCYVTILKHWYMKNGRYINGRQVTICKDCFDNYIIKDLKNILTESE